MENMIGPPFDSIRDQTRNDTFLYEILNTTLANNGNDDDAYI